MFEDHEDVEYFCMDVIGDLPCIKEVRYVIENFQNIIVIFDSEDDKPDISNELFGALQNDNVKFYFLFERENLITAHIPEEVKDFIYKPDKKNIMEVEYKRPVKENFDLDELLDKIEKQGIDSLTPEEKKFLDNFEN
jgi:hypothetical protein